MLAMCGLALAVVMVACSSKSETASPTAAATKAATSVSTSVAKSTTAATTAATATATAKASASATAAASAVASAPAGAFCTGASDCTINQVAAGASGQRLVDAGGRSLYTFKNDTAGSGTSACTGGCPTNWPPLTISTGSPLKPSSIAGQLGTITRDDGSKQVTYNGQPLYHFASDTAPGDTKGDGVANLWSLAKP